ncbi:hypothetical protein [Aeromonas veronii]|uniref:Uncharacterized protein n=1 Tax=Aeromonas veronii TaxID=654 RepID=A0A2T4MWT7_AERVE|nr:hypothetical protein [Aeromonas veronii]PTH79051.1 hypothetical protein DAA48_21680 [Aeromonas veronii]
MNLLNLIIEKRTKFNPSEVSEIKLEQKDAPDIIIKGISLIEQSYDQEEFCEGKGTVVYSVYLTKSGNIVFLKRVISILAAADTAEYKSEKAEMLINASQNAQISKTPNPSDINAVATKAFGYSKTAKEFYKLTEINACQVIE